MIHPDNNVAVRIVRRPDRQRRIVIANHHQRAGGIEADPGDRRRRNAGAGHRRFNAVAHRLPDLTARLLDLVSAAAKQGYFLVAWARSSPRRLNTPARTLPEPTSTPIMFCVSFCITSSHRLARSEIHAVRQDHNVAHGDVFERVTINSTDSATSIGCIRLPLASASSILAFGQSSSRAVTTGPGSMAPTRTPYCATGDEWCAQMPAPRISTRYRQAPRSPAPRPRSSW